MNLYFKHISSLILISVKNFCFRYARLDANKHAHSIQDITNKALGSGGLERIRPTNKQLMPTTGESKVPFSQGIVPRKGTTMPKPRWHAPWKLMRVRLSNLNCTINFLVLLINNPHNSASRVVRPDRWYWRLMTLFTSIFSTTKKYLFILNDFCSNKLLWLGKFGRNLGGNMIF